MIVCTNIEKEHNEGKISGPEEDFQWRLMERSKESVPRLEGDLKNVEMTSKRIKLGHLTIVPSPPLMGDWKKRSVLADSLKMWKKYLFSSRIFFRYL